MPRFRGLLHVCSLCFALGVGSVAAQSVTIGPGDNLWSVARAHDTTVAALMEANGLSDDRLKIGQVLKVPGSDVERAIFDATVVVTHVVEPGDSLWSLARTYDTSVPALMALNGLASDRLSLGQRLRLPAAPIMTAPPAPSATTQVSAPATEVAAPTTPVSAAIGSSIR